jgi:glutathionyl-hydroquinone reductase
MGKTPKPKVIKPGELFQMHNSVWSFTLNELQEVILKRHREVKVKGKTFTPPTLQQVQAFFTEKGYTGAETFYEYYQNGNPPWSDRAGIPVSAWKQKAISVWFKESSKIVVPDTNRDGNDKYNGMVF